MNMDAVRRFFTTYTVDKLGVGFIATVAVFRFFTVQTDLYIYYYAAIDIILVKNIVYEIQRGRISEFSIMAPNREQCLTAIILLAIVIAYAVNYVLQASSYIFVVVSSLYFYALFFIMRTNQWYSNNELLDYPKKRADFSSGTTVDYHSELALIFKTMSGDPETLTTAKRHVCINLALLIVAIFLLLLASSIESNSTMNRILTLSTSFCVYFTVKPSISNYTEFSSNLRWILNHLGYSTRCSMLDYYGYELNDTTLTTIFVAALLSVVKATL